MSESLSTCMVHEAAEKEVSSWKIGPSSRTEQGVGSEPLYRKAVCRTLPAEGSARPLTSVGPPTRHQA